MGNLKDPSKSNGKSEESHEKEYKVGKIPSLQKVRSSYQKREVEFQLHNFDFKV